MLTLLGVKPILCAAVACDVSVCWTFFFNLVSKLTATKLGVKAHYSLAVEKAFQLTFS